EFRYRFRDIGFRRRAAFTHRIGGIANQCKATLLSERAQFLLVSGVIQYRGRIDLPVPCMQHRAAGCADDQSIRFRDRMRHCDELDVERPYTEPAAERDDIY